MSRYVLSAEADHDIEQIILGTLARWGWVQAENYVAGMHKTFELLGALPQLGRRVDRIRPGYLRFEHASHSIFYQRAEDGILIVRVLHGRMNPQNHL